MAEGFENLVNMDGGFLGRRDMSGEMIEPGWTQLDYPTEASAPAERTYEALKATN